MFNKTKVVLIFLSLSISLISCSFPATSAGEGDYLSTSIELTVAAVDQKLNQPTWTPIPVNPTALYTATAIPTATPLVSPTPTEPTSYCNEALLVGESPYDNKKFAPGATFTKKWSIQNTGRCSWNSDYEFVFVRGDQMGGPDSIDLSGSIGPGGVWVIDFDLKAPSSDGTYKGVWAIQNDLDYNFAEVWVQIEVGDGGDDSSSDDDPDFAVTSVDLSAASTVINAPCPYTFHFDVDVEATEEGTISYYYSYSEGSDSAQWEVDLDSNGEKSWSSYQSFNSTGTHWVKLYINEPNHQWFGPLEFDLTCTP